MQNVIISLVIKIIAEAAKNEDVRKFVLELVKELADKLKDDLVPALIALFPTFGGAIIKSALDFLPEVDLPDIDVLNTDIAKKIVDADPDLPFVSDIIDITEILKGWIK
ncbi:hypothetical protein THIBAULT_40 [Mycobacterium phage Thibault]|uniref:Uncharacterized protein n=1 Tax=Mycobacterium phage Thibault TaxID=1052673 RepID=G1FGA5_9CAUD|nr:hypothetical protein CL87_gp040 [Mycobacterium phage Thibault]AEJ93988.1 hypothetical protein THIBAULT_40 [Mycobacterium phage Thibault]